MKYAALVLLLPALLSAQPFQQETNTIPVEIYGWQPFAPWVGGFTTTTPELCDIDGDADLDFFEGFGYWTIAFFKNVGSTSEPLFSYITYGFDSLLAPAPAGGGSPEFCDIDDDGDLDAFISGAYALTNYYENVGTNSNPQFVFMDTLRAENGTLIWGEHLNLADVDADGDEDLFAGRYFGWINFYENVGTPDSFSFQILESQFEGIDVGGWADPCLFDLDNDRDYDLFIGNYDGNIWFYENRGDTVNWDFQLVNTNYDSIDVWKRATPVAAKIDGDDDYDLFSGRDVDGYAPRGDIFFWENQGTAQVADFHYITSEYLTMDEGSDGTQCFGDLDADGDYDMLIGSGQDMSFFRNIGTPTSPSFLLETENYQGLAFFYANPVLYDLDADGDLDLITGEGTFTQGVVKFWNNRGTPQQAMLQYWFTVTQPGAWGSAIDVADIDADGDGDLFFGDAWGDLYYFENTGTPYLPSYTFGSQNFQNINYASTIYPRFYDWDGDDDLDLFLNDGGLYAYYENFGSPTNTQLQWQTGDFFGEGYGMSLSIVDIDADSDPDFFFSGAGGVSFVRNLEVNAVSPAYRHPQAGLQLSLGPNPANPITVIRCELRIASQISLEVFDISGRKLVEVASGFHLPGEYRYLLDMRDKASGIYLVRLRTPQQTFAEKLTIIK